MPKVALLLGSSRSTGNVAGLAAWLKSLLENRLNANSSTVGAVSEYTITIVDPTQPPLPLGPIVEGAHIPAEIKDPSQHSSPAICEWATFVLSCDLFVILTPQYNWSFPGELKNSLDHLYWEWRGKPVMLVTYGGHGGNKCAAALRIVLDGGLHMRVVPKSVEITLPGGYIRDKLRVTADGPFPDFLDSYVTDVHEAVDQLKGMLNSSATE